MENPFADIVENQIERHATRLPFDEMCAFYSALCEGVIPAVVARASGLKPQTMASLRAAGTWHAGQMRYPKVAEEYRSLGREAFIHKYVTASIRDRLRIAADQVKRKKLEPPPAGASNPRANGYAGRQAIKDPLGGPPITVTIEFDRQTPGKPGWTWREYAGWPEPKPGFDGAPVLRGDPRHQERRFASSRDCLDFCRLRFCPTEAELGTPEQEATGDDRYFYQTFRSLRT